MSAANRIGTGAASRDCAARVPQIVPEWVRARGSGADKVLQVGPGAVAAGLATRTAAEGPVTAPGAGVGAGQ